MKDKIIEHSTRMFARDGLKAVRMDDIAAEIGVSKRTIYEHFEDKEALILASLDYFHGRMHAFNDELTRDAGNIIAEYLLLMEVYDSQVDATHRLMGDAHKFYPRLYEQFIREHSQTGLQRLRLKIEQGIRDGWLIPTLNIELAMIVVGHSMYGAIKAEGLGDSGATRREAFKFFVTHFMRGIATQKGIELIDKKLNIG